MTILLPMVAKAFTGDVEIDGIYYNIVTKGKVAVVISKPRGEYSGIINIPPSVTYDGVECSVTSIGDWAFSGCRDLISVTIPNSVITIGEYAFRYCNSMTSVSLGNNVTTIGGCAFQTCSALTSITIPNSVTRIKAYAFYDCSGLTTLTLPNSVMNIEDYAFHGCRNLTSITLPSNMTSINRDVFSGCSSLKSIVIPNNVTSIGYSAFSGCNGLKSVVLGKNVIEIGELAFNRCKSLNSVSLPQSVEKIWSSAFYGCSNLSSIVIPDGVKTIHKETFRGCSNLKQIIIGSGVERIYDNSFAECSEIADVYCYAEQPPVTSITAFNDSYIEYATLHVQESAISSYKGNRPWSDFKDIVEVLPIYTLTYLIDGEVYKIYITEEGATISPESIPIKEGYTFLGWKDLPETMPAYDVTVTGSFSINSYKLKYVVDGVEYKTVEVEYNSTITPEAEPTKEGYTFSGWSGIPETMPANDVTVTGSYVVNTYTLTYMVDGEIYKTSEVDYGATITPEEAPTKTGYSFSGWDDVPLTMPAKDVTVSGTFTINSYKLTYIVDGEEYKTFEIVYDSAITPETEPTKEGHTFSGWSDIPERMPANDVTVTGSFIVNKYQITYVIDGDVFATEYVEYGATIVPPTVEEREGYSFSGWNDVPETMPAHDIVVNASYTSGIIGALIASQQNVRIYSPNGKKLDKIQKGLNIVILDDGTVKKVVVK